MPSDAYYHAVLEQKLLPILNDGKIHSAPDLAARFAVSRVAIAKAMHTLASWGLAIQSLPGQDYRLATPLELLSRTALEAALTDAARGLISGIEIHPNLASTNSHLLTRARQGHASGLLCLAERQAAGRGRRGRPWVSPFAANLYLSLLWRFRLTPAVLSGLSLAAGVAVAQALEAEGVPAVQLKWPNDVLWQHRKLGGLLLEIGQEPDGGCCVVAGVGLNIAMPAATAIDQPWIDLHGIVGPDGIARNRLAGRLASALATLFATFGQQGFAALRAEWERFDCMMGQRVHIKQPSGVVAGTARGVDEAGALLLETSDGGLQRFWAGEVSLRLVP